MASFFKSERDADSKPARTPSPRPARKKATVEAEAKGGAGRIGGQGGFRQVGLKPGGASTAVRPISRPSSAAGTSGRTIPDEAVSVLGLGPSGTALVERFVLGLREQGAALFVRELTAANAARLGSQLAEQLVAQLRWSSRVGDTLTTTEVRSMLALSRQALGSRRRSGSLLGLSDVRGTTRYPSWQFDVESRGVRPQVAMVCRPFRAELPEVREDQIVSWASTPQDDLDERSPAQWIACGEGDDRLVQSATRAALRLAQ